MLKEISLIHCFEDVDITIDHDFDIVTVAVDHDFAADGTTCETDGRLLDGAEDKLTLTLDGVDAEVIAILQISADDETYTDIEASEVALETESTHTWELADYEIPDNSYIRVKAVSAEATEGTVVSVVLLSTTVTSSAVQVYNTDQIAVLAVSGHNGTVNAHLEASADGVTYEKVDGSDVEISDEEAGALFPLTGIVAGTYLRVVVFSTEATEGNVDSFAIAADGATMTSPGIFLDNTKAIAVLRCTGHDAAITAHLEVSVDNASDSFIELPESETTIAVGQSVTQWHIQHYLLPKGTHIRVVASSSATEGTINHVKVLSHD